MQPVEFLTPRGVLASPLPEDDSLPIASLVRPATYALGAFADASAPHALLSDRYGMLTAAELERWS